MAVLPCHVFWLRWVSENNLYAPNTQVAAPSDKIVWLPIRAKTCAQALNLQLLHSQIALLMRPVLPDSLRGSTAIKSGGGGITD